MVTESQLFCRKHWPFLALLVLVLFGIALTFSGIIDWRYLLDLAKGYTDFWWLLVVLITVQALLYTFALPGSLMVWIAAPLYEPAIAATILVIGSTLGGMFAYLFVHHASKSWVEKITQKQLFHVLQEHGDFLTLCALRAMPNFPQSVVNYGSGLLHLPIAQFLMASIIGFSLKCYLYSVAIHGAVIAEDPSELIKLDTLAPLIIIVVLLVVAKLLQLRWLRTQRNKGSVRVRK